MKNNLILGAGFTGAVIAERIASQLGEPVMPIDQRLHIGGNAYDCHNDHGVLIHKYGPHIFQADAPRILDYVSRFTRWLPYEDRVVGLVNDQSVHIPFNNTEGRRVNALLTEAYDTEVKVPILKMRQTESADVRRSPT